MIHSQSFRPFESSSKNSNFRGGKFGRLYAGGDE